MSGIIRYGSYVPYFRLHARRARRGQGRARGRELRRGLGLDGGRGGARRACAAAPRSTRCCSPPRARPTPRSSNAATIQAALDLPESIALARARRLDAHGARARCSSGSTSPPPAGARSCAPRDVVIGAPGGARESERRRRRRGVRHRPRRRGDRARASAAPPPPPSCSTSGACPRSASRSQWEERFGAEMLGAGARRHGDARAARRAASSRRSSRRVILDATQPARHGGPAARAAASSPSSSPIRSRRSVGRAGAAHAGLLLARALDQREARRPHPGGLRSPTAATRWCSR